MDAAAARDLLARVIDWPAVSPAARQAASNMWHDLADPNVTPGQLGGAMTRLTGHLRACRYTRDPGIAAVVDELRGRLAGDGEPPWEPRQHDVFAARTRAAARAAGLDLTERKG